MIKIESITIKEFRGIRNLTLNFKGKNFAICGPNGTGKSGVVDALEFVLTGNISRLSGEGRGEVSLKQHAPHVDKRNDPAKALVSATVIIPSLKKTYTVERSAKTPSMIKVTPSDQAATEIFATVQEHPEIVLSRRELIRYVLATPGKRNEEIQALLHLDQIEDVRAGLQKIANSMEKQLKPFETAATSATENLARALAISELSKEYILSTANAQRTILGLPFLADFTTTTSLKDGMSVPAQTKPQTIPKAQAVTDIRAAREILKEISGKLTESLVADVLADLNLLAADKAVVEGVTRQHFYTFGLNFIEAEVCPFCDNEWDVEALRTHVRSKLEHLKELSTKRKAVEKKLLPLITLLRKAETEINLLIRYAAMPKPAIEMRTAQEYVTRCNGSINLLEAFLPLADTIAILRELTDVPQTVEDAISRLEKEVAVLPDPSKQDAALEFLTIAQERLDVWRESRRKEETARAQAQLARRVSDIYASTSDKVLTGLYDDVQKDFAALYTAINHTDEKNFAAKLVPSMGKLGFDVDFYGRGFFPPGAYHSEGHQDGMGLCLYLALMRHIEGAHFTFAVLDDVLMSVDTGHRREVCVLLKKEFPNTQFITTTHDPIWMRHMKTEGLIGSQGAVQFRTWNVDSGPTQWDDRDVWTEINDYLAKNDVRSAAALLRHYLEYTSAELCHRLRCHVEFRGDAQYQLGELLPPATSRLRKLYATAKEAANSWNQKDLIAEISERDNDFSKLAQLSQVEQWQVNAAVHFNSWDNLTKNDFLPVAEAFRKLLAGFACPDCSEFFRVSPDRDTAETIRCECGKTNINLRKKT